MARCTRCKRSLGFGIADCSHCKADSPATRPSERVGVSRVQGVNGQLELTERSLRISREGFLAFIGHGMKGDKDIAIEHVTSIQFKQAGSFVNGYIQFAFMGGQEAKGGVFQGATDENTVMFNEGQERDFRRFKAELERRIARARSPQAAATVPAVNALDDLERLATMRDRGILTEDEFVAKKRQILGL